MASVSEMREYFWAVFERELSGGNSGRDALNQAADSTQYVFFPGGDVEVGKVSVSFRFAWYDMWIGAYWDRTCRVLYICLLPCCLITIRREIERRHP